MRIFDETKTKELLSYDQTEGFLRPDKLVTHHESVPEKVIKSVQQIIKELTAEGKEVNLRSDGNYYVVTDIVYRDGVRWGNEEEIIEPIVEPAVDAWDEEEEIAVFVPYTGKQKVEQEIFDLKQKLFDSDYKAIKYAEGYISEDEYSSIRIERQAWRDRINQLEETLINIEE